MALYSWFTHRQNISIEEDKALNINTPQNNLSNQNRVTWPTTTVDNMLSKGGNISKVTNSITKNQVPQIISLKLLTPKNV